MRDESKQDPVGAASRAERLVVVHVLACGEGLPQARLVRRLWPIEREPIAEAVASLAAAEVVLVTRRRVYPSPALRRLDALELIAI